MEKLPQSKNLSENLDELKKAEELTSQEDSVESENLEEISEQKSSEDLEEAQESNMDSATMTVEELKSLVEEEKIKVLEGVEIMEAGLATQQRMAELEMALKNSPLHFDPKTGEVVGKETEFTEMEKEVYSQVNERLTHASSWIAGATMSTVLATLSYFAAKDYGLDIGSFVEAAASHGGSGLDAKMQSLELAKENANMAVLTHVPLVLTAGILSVKAFMKKAKTKAASNVYLQRLMGYKAEGVSSETAENLMYREVSNNGFGYEGYQGAMEYTEEYKPEEVKNVQSARDALDQAGISRIDRSKY